MIVSSRFEVLNEFQPGRKYVAEIFTDDSGEEYSTVYLAEPGTDLELHLNNSRTILEQSLAEAEVNSLFDQI